MAQEIELKLKAPEKWEPTQLINFLESKYSVTLEYIHQLDEYYDNDSNDIKNADMTLRIRTTNDRTIIALKSPRLFVGNISSRIELEFPALNRDDVMKEIYSKMLKPVSVIEKRRWSLDVENYNVVIDEIPFIGYFIEIEGSSVENVRAFVQEMELFDFTEEKLNYSELLTTYFEREGVDVSKELIARF